MLCANCEDIRRTDNELPDCERGEGCKIPPLWPANQTAMELRRRILLGRDLGFTAEYTVRVFGGATELEMRMIYESERILKETHGG